MRIAPIALVLALTLPAAATAQEHPRLLYKAADVAGTRHAIAQTRETSSALDWQTPCNLFPAGGRRARHPETEETVGHRTLRSTNGERK